MKLNELTHFLDDYLSVNEIDDIALNGLQVEGNEEVNTIALATDACAETFMKAASLRADLLLAHHGIYWGKVYPLRGIHAERIKLLFDNRISLYAVHLPLDLHPEVGNNVELIRLLGYDVSEPFGIYHGVAIGYVGRRKDPVGLQSIIDKLNSELFIDPLVYRFGSDQIRNIGVITGRGTSVLEQVTGTDIDLFITGEADHTSYHLAKELQVNLIFSGHYATETLGVRCLGSLLEKRFGLKTVFIDVPTGM